MDVFLYMLIIFRYTNKGAPKVYKNYIFFIIISCIFKLIYFQLQLLINQIILLILILNKPSIIIEKLNKMAFDVTGINIIEF